jgi:hypothetical protein
MRFDCFKCGGSGMTSFTHIENGVCFQCGGSGKLSYRSQPKVEADPHPELLVPEADRSTLKQWSFLARLTGDSDDQCRKFLKAAGAPFASQRYVTKAVMSRAIDLAKAA